MSFTAHIINQFQRKVFLFLIATPLAVGVPVFAAGSTSKPAWEKPRELSDFQSLLDHSPFCLPTAEESSPLADRYALTGIVTISGEEEVFVFDRTDQTREMLTHTPNPKNMSLVSLVREGTAAPQKATIRVGGDTGTIGYLEAAPQQQAQPMTQQAPPGSPNVIRPAIPRLPALPQPPGANNPAVVTGPRPAGISPQTRRIIRRPMVNPPQAPTQ